MRPFEGIKILDCTHVLAGPFGEHTDEVLGAVGYTAEQIAALRRSGAVA
jgi:crotonobetainyl-CoA:carnitine CoA-transferase CaiB-like acyl-CoA transferase